MHGRRKACASPSIPRSMRRSGCGLCIEPCPWRQTTMPSRLYSQEAPRATQPPPPEPRAALRCLQHPKTNHRPAANRRRTPATSTRRKQPAASKLSHSVGNEQRHDFVRRDYLGAACQRARLHQPAIKNLTMQPTAQMIHRRPRRDTKMGFPGAASKSRD